MSAKLELSLRGLLKYCEKSAEEDNTDYRLKKYVKTLDHMFSELEVFEDVEIKSLSSYSRRIKELKSLINYKEPAEDYKRTGPEVGDVMREIRTIKNAKSAHETRKELLGEGVRQRPQQPGSGDMQQVAKHYESLQEKFAEEMLMFTHQLKEQTEAANRIIKRDTEILENSNKKTDKNLDKLKGESTKLQEHSNRACKCWIWLMVAVTIATFIFMVLFIRVTKKRG